MSAAHNNYSLLPPPPLSYGTSALRPATAHANVFLAPCTAAVPVLPPPLPSSSRAVTNAATRENLPAPIGEIGPQERDRGERGTRDPESRRTGPKGAARTSTGCLPALALPCSPRVYLPRNGRSSAELVHGECVRCVRVSQGVSSLKPSTPRRRRRTGERECQHSVRELVSCLGPPERRRDCRVVTRLVAASSKSPSNFPSLSPVCSACVCARAASIIIDPPPVLACSRSYKR